MHITNNHKYANKYYKCIIIIWILVHIQPLAPTKTRTHPHTVAHTAHDRTQNVHNLTYVCAIQPLNGIYFETAISLKPQKSTQITKIDLLTFVSKIY